jgi:hypothetical protein
MSAIRKSNDGNIDVALWDGIDPESAIDVALAVYGSSAVTAAAWCAVTARCDGREGDYRFWLDVFKRLRN